MAGIRNAIKILGALATLCALAGCSTVQGLSGAPHPGYQENGSYVLSDQEQGLGCRGLQERSMGLQEQMQKLSKAALEQMQQLPGTVVSAWGRVFGSPGDGVPAIAEYKEVQAESAAVDATMARKGCPIETASIRR
jgi:uncharacterized protein YceK